MAWKDLLKTKTSFQNEMPCRQQKSAEKGPHE